MSYFSTREEAQLQSLPAGWLPTNWINSGSLRSVIEYSVHFSYTRAQHQTVHTHRASVHQAAKLVAALLRVARVTACVAESNGSLPPGLWLTSPAGWLPRTGISSVTLCSVIEYGLALWQETRKHCGTADLLVASRACTRDEICRGRQRRVHQALSSAEYHSPSTASDTHHWFNCSFWTWLSQLPSWF